MQTLNYRADNFDQDNTFAFNLNKPNKYNLYLTGYLFNDGDQIFIMQKSAMLKSHYTDKDNQERDRLNNMTPIKTGDIVSVEGKQYQVKILGDYSDAGRLIPV